MKGNKTETDRVLKVHLGGFMLGTVKRFVQVSGMIESRNYVFITTAAITRNTHRSTHAE